MSILRVPTWEEAMDKAEKNVTRRYTMVPVEDSPSQKELEEYARKHIATLEELVAREDRCHEGQIILHNLLEGLTPGLRDIVYDYLYDVMSEEFVEKMKTGERLD